MNSLRELKNGLSEKKTRKRRYIPEGEDGKNVRGFCPTKAYRGILRPETRQRLEAYERTVKESREA